MLKLFLQTTQKRTDRLQINNNSELNPVTTFWNRREKEENVSLGNGE